MRNASLFWQKIKTYLAAGLLVVLPAVITGYVLWLIFNITDGLLGSLLDRFINTRIPGLGLLAMLILLFLTGLFTANYLGKRLLGWAEQLLFKIPLVGSIYSTIRKFAEAVAAPDRGVFRQVVLVEYPRAGLYSLGFLTGRSPSNLNKVAGRTLANVFIPTVPNITTGFVLHVPLEDLIYPAMSVDEGLKFVVSAGVIRPDSIDGGKGETY